MSWDRVGQAQINNQFSDEDATPAPQDVEVMALVLEGRHGAFAAEVATFFSDYHSHRGDAGRSWAWAGVADVVRQRLQMRSAQDL